MSEDLSIPRQDNRSDDVETMQWGQGSPPRRPVALRALGNIGRDRRIVPVLAGLGTVAVFASLIGEWTITTISPGDAGPGGPYEVAPARMVGKVSEVASFGAGYLVGVLALFGCLALVLFGTPGVRPNARVLGLATSGGLLGLLVGAASAVKDQAERQFGYGLPGQVNTELGRGLIMAYVGTAILGLALLLAGRLSRRPAGSAPGGATIGPSTEPPCPGPDHDPDWPWRRSRAATRPSREETPPTPINLTVAPTKPFARTEPPETH